MRRSLRDETGTGTKRVLVLLLLLATLTATAAAREIVVTSTADRGAGTLRSALQTARSGDVITFDAGVFPPDESAVIRVRDGFPPLRCGNLTIDASDAGVTLDGSSMPEGTQDGFYIISDGNIIRGLQIVGFPANAITLADGASSNIIGGDRSIGAGPAGQGNVLSKNRECGIGMYHKACSANIIAGNLIGTDDTGTRNWGNAWTGIFIGAGADNTIGPDNVVAFNGRSGIELSSLRNTVTRNSIHDNTLAALANGDTQPPVITYADLGGGTAVGVACSGCTVELFSTPDDEATEFEGATVADASGSFSFSKGVPIAGPFVTGTAAAPGSGTSSLSMPVGGSSAIGDMQLGNSNPQRILERLASSELSYNRIGTMFPLQDSQPSDAAQWIIETMDGFGFMWNKYYIDPPDWPEVGVLGGFSTHHVTGPQDAVVDGLLERGIKTFLGIVYWPDTIQEGIEQQGWDFSRFSTDTEISDYVEFARFLARHFSGRVEYYEILNEPDLDSESPPEDRGQHVRVKDYVRLVKAAVPAIREEDPTAKIIIGGVSREQSGIDFLFEMLDSGVASLSDAIAWHPNFGPSPGELWYSDYYYGYPTLARSIKERAWSQGFEGEFMATEVCYRTSLNPNPRGDEPWEHSPIVAAKYFARGIVLNLGLDLVVGPSAELFWQITPVISAISNLCTVMASHEAIDMTVGIDIEYDGPVAYCAFRYPNGDRMLAVWTDGIAQDEDLGIPATIAFPGLAAGKVTGINVLHGFEQELVFEIDGEDTIIRDLLVKDYPTLLRLSDATFGPNYDETVGDGFHRFGDINAVSSSPGSNADRDGDGVPDNEDFCPDWPGSPETSGC
jgi:hypothetical protein